MPSANTSIGVVGVGRMGANIARRLKDRAYSVTALHDIRSHAARALAAEIGAECVGSPADPGDPCQRRCLTSQHALPAQLNNAPRGG